METYTVVVNHEEQYSIWPVDREIPSGWKSVGTPGTKEDCLKYVEDTWTDMRPLSLRQAMDERGSAGGDTLASAEPDAYEGTVERLTKGSHLVRLALDGDRDGDKGADAFRRALNAGYVHVEFTESQGGTNLGVRLNRDECDLQDWEAGAPAGRVRLVGRLTLDYVRLRCTADIDLTTFAGSGRLDVDASPR